MAQLQRLQLQYNQLTSLDASTFSGLSQLQWLGLQDNRLTTLGISIFNVLSQLKELSMEYTVALQLCQPICFFQKC
jgi:Leucine-rich repeat (LRR) protein